MVILRRGRARGATLVHRTRRAGVGCHEFVAHAGGPPISIALLPMRLAPAVFAGTTSVFFTVINASKWLPYAALGLIDVPNMLTAAARHRTPCLACGWA